MRGWVGYKRLNVRESGWHSRQSRVRKSDVSEPRDDRSPLQKLWDTYCSIRAEQGLDIADIFSGWAKEQKESLRKFQAESSFEDLCKHGCREFPLALALAALGPLKRIASIWASVTGPPRRREQRIRLFEKAATALEELQAAFVDSLSCGVGD